MRKIDQFTNRYSVSKTLQFQLIPMGKTEEHFQNAGILQQDEERAVLYRKVKKYIDEYHKDFIARKLSKLKTLDISAYAELYYKTNRSDAESDELKKLAEELREKIVAALTEGEEGHKNEKEKSKKTKKDKKGNEDPEFKKLFGKECITELIPKWLKEKEQIAEVEQFKKFTTYFIGFYDNRKNMYSAKEQSTAIAYRCIHDNLPRFLDNIKAFQKIVEVLPRENLCKLEEELQGIVTHGLREQFSAEFFVNVLTQNGLDQYNYVIGGYAPEEGENIKGVNQYVNEYSQQHRDVTLPELKPLYKQILSDRGTVSFRPEPYQKDEEVLEDVATYCKMLEKPLAKLEKLFSELGQFDLNGIFVRNQSALTELSAELLGYWGQLRDNWNEAYDRSKTEKELKKASYADDREKAWKKLDSLSVAALEELSEGKSVVAYYQNRVIEQIAEIRERYAQASELLATIPYKKEKKLAKNDRDIELLKNLLDAIKRLENTLFGLRGSGTEPERDGRFYSEYSLQMDVLEQLDRLYDKVRNYITKKPYSTEKIKLNFENPQLLGGWDRNKEREYKTVLLRRDGLYYLAIMDKSHNKLFLDYPTDGSNGWEKMNYKLLPGPNKMLPKVFFAKSNIAYYAPSEEILRIYDNETFKKGKNFSQKDCHKLIEFYQASIARHPDWNGFGFSFKKPDQYADISEFYNEVARQGYRLDFTPIAEAYINRLVEEGKLYLFQLYNKDFSPKSKGTPNLHTLYFKMLFDERNLRDPVYQLNGGAEMFYRHPSISKAEQVVHPAGEAIRNRRNDGSRTLPYDVIKDRRFTRAQFSLHIPIKLNFQPEGKERINPEVRKAIRDSEKNYVIGIDRGERNLIYITVVDDRGRIVEQFSCNEVVDGKFTTDYHKLLDQREKERMEARQSWKTIEGIKDLKEGYISQVIHRICQLVKKYDAVIAMEDLNSGFKNSRAKVEKQVYQKFEKMLIDKLSYWADKKKDPETNGGLLRAYQLTEKFTSFHDMRFQNGFIFYVNPWDTSKIDPTTGFVDLLKPKYVSIEKSRDYIGKFRSIRYDAAEELFEFSFDYRDFSASAKDHTHTWTVCTYGDRIRSQRDRNGHYSAEQVKLTALWKELMQDYGIDYAEADLKSAILAQDSKEFFERFMYLLRLTLQLRNSGRVMADGELQEFDYIISPVRNACGTFFDSRDYDKNPSLPADADANGAYHIAIKALWVIRNIQSAEEEKLNKVKVSISNEEWLRFAQTTAAERLGDRK